MGKDNDNFEAAWPKDGTLCPCSESHEGRTTIIEKMIGLSEVVHVEMQRLGICPAMYPHALGMVAAFSLGYLEQSLSPATHGLSLLQFPDALGKVAIVEKSARCLMLAAQEGGSASH